MASRAASQRCCWNGRVRFYGGAAFRFPTDGSDILTETASVNASVNQE